MMNYKLYKNVLDQEEFTKLKETMSNSFVAWFYNPSTIPDKDDHFMFTHHIYRNGQVTSDLYNNTLPLLMFCASKTEKINLLRVKANLYTNQNKNVYHAKHTDFVDLDNYKTCVYNFTTCDGGTVLFKNNKKVVVESIENSMLIFDGNIEHQGFTQTNTQIRLLLNIDFN